MKVHSALLLVAIIYGANYSIAKVALPDYLMPFGFILLRISCATILFWILDFFTSFEKIENKKDFFLLLVCAVFGVAANQLLFFNGLSLTNPINASVIMTTSPIMVLLTAFIMKQERLTLIKVIGVIIAGIGAYLLVTKDGISLSNGTFLGDLFILLNGTSYAIYLVLVKPLMAKYKAITVIKWLFLFGMIYTLPFGLGGLSTVEWSTIPIEVWLSIVYVVLGATFIVYLLNIWALKFVNASIVGIYIYLQPVVSTITAITFRGDQLDITTVFCSLMIMLGVFIVSRF